MKCPKCGKEIVENSVFCSYCGQRVNKPIPAKVWFKKSTIIWIILGSVLYGILAGGIISYKMLKPLPSPVVRVPQPNPCPPGYDEEVKKLEAAKARIAEANARAAEAKAEQDRIAAEKEKDRKAAEEAETAKAEAEAKKAEAETAKAKAEAEAKKAEAKKAEAEAQKVAEAKKIVEIKIRTK